MKTVLFLVALCVLCSGSNCLDSQSVLSGQLGQITDVSIVACKPYQSTANTHQCLILANPSLGVLKVFDATDNQFVLSPIAYFPLVIQIGQAPNNLATLNNQSFTLDPIKQAIYEVPNSFISPITKPFLDLQFSPNYFVLVENNQGQPWALLSATDNRLRARPLKEGIAFQVQMPCSPDLMQLNSSNTYLLTACDKEFWIVPISNLWQTTPQWPTQFVSLSSPIRTFAADSQKALLALEDATLVMVDLAKAQIESTSSVLESTAVAVYLPGTLPGSASTCCNGASDWISALLSSGKLIYWPYAEKSFQKKPAVMDIAQEIGIPPYAFTAPIKLLGLEVQPAENDALGCSRRLFLVYTGFILNTCEGSSNIKRVDQKVY